MLEFSGLFTAEYVSTLSKRGKKHDEEADSTNKDKDLVDEDLKKESEIILLIVCLLLVFFFGVCLRQTKPIVVGIAVFFGLSEPLAVYYAANIHICLSRSSQLDVTRKSKSKL